MTTPPPGWYPDDRGTPLPYPDDDPKGLSSGRKWIVAGVAAGAVVGVAAVVVLAGVVGYAIRGGDDAAAGGAPTAAAPTETLLVPTLPPVAEAYVPPPAPPPARVIEQPSLQQRYLDRLRERVPVSARGTDTVTDLGMAVCAELGAGMMMVDAALVVAINLDGREDATYIARWVVYVAREVLCPWVPSDGTITPPGR